MRRWEKRKNGLPVTQESEVPSKEMSIQELMYASMTRVDPAEILSEKLPPAILEKMVDIRKLDRELGWKDRDQERQDRKHQRLMTLLYVVLEIAVFLAVLVLFQAVFSADALMLERFLIAVGGLVAGGAGGYGLGRWKKSE